jgi:transposase
MKPYSKDLRVKVLTAVDRGMPRKEVAQVFGVSEPTIRRYLKLRRQTGDVQSPSRCRDLRRASGRLWRSGCPPRFSP